MKVRRKTPRTEIGLAWPAKEPQKPSVKQPLVRLDMDRSRLQAMSAQSTRSQTDTEVAISDPAILDTDLRLPGLKSSDRPYAPYEISYLLETRPNLSHSKNTKAPLGTEAPTELAHIDNNLLRSTGKFIEINSWIFSRNYSASAAAYYSPVLTPTTHSFSPSTH